jgi:ribosomal protein S18 acetylase RimI-like enzyme
MQMEKYLRWKDAPEFAEGAQAAKDGRHFKDYCPYTYAETGEAFSRDKLDAYFAGWYTTSEAQARSKP